ncbi:MAG: MarR family winged helix-turn-helix transcriptional regulator [Bdellovibrio sp.]
MRFKDTIGISYLIKNVENLLRNAIDAEIGKLGLSLSQYTALSCLEVNKKMTNAEVARDSHVTPQTMNKIMMSLTRVKLVRKSFSEESKLKVYYELTEKAEKLLCDAHAAVNKVELRAISGINKKDFLSTQKSMTTLENNLKAKSLKK